MASPLRVLIGLSALSLSASGFAQVTEPAPVPGASTAGLTDPGSGRAAKSQRWAWWTGDRWDAVLPTSTGWRLYTDMTGSTTQGAVVDSRQAARVDTWFEDDSLWVLRGHTSQPRITRYNLAGGAYSADGSVTDVAISALSAAHADRSPAVLYRTPNGRLWAAVVNGSNAVVAISDNNGASWSTANVVSVSTTGVAMLAHSGGTVVLIVMENDAGGRHVRTIAQGAGSIAAGNWASETLPALPTGIASDDHGMAVTVEGHIYAVSKTDGSSSDAEPLLYMVDRDFGGTWSYTQLRPGPDNQGDTRPVIVAGSTGLHVGYGRNQNPMDVNVLELVRADLAVPSPVMLVDGGNYADSVVPPRSISNGSGLLWLAHDRATDTVMRVWQPDFVDITERAVEPVTGGFGRTSESDTAGPTSWTLTLRNDDGALSPRNPLGPWYGQLSQNTPLRLVWDDSARSTVFLSELPTTWPGVVEVSRVPVRADGLFRRLSQGAERLSSALTRHVPTVATVAGYWPMEDGETARSCASPLPGVAPLRVGGDVDFASADGPPGSDQLLRFLPGATFTGSVPPHSPSGAWRCDWVFRMDDDPTEARTTGRYVTASGLQFVARISADNFLLQVRNKDGDLIHNVSEPRSEMLFGAVLRFTLVVTQSGSNLNATLTASRDGMVINQVSSGTISSQPLSRVVRTWMGVLADDINFRMLGHITVSGSSADPWAANGLTAFDGFTGERAARRIERLCVEERLRCTIVGDRAATMPMGPQRPDTVLVLLRECEATDFGRLADFDGGLWYRTRADLYNRDPVLVLGEMDLLSSPEALDDDRFLRNDVTASARAGSSARVVDEASVRRAGRYEESLTVNPAGDTRLGAIAGWGLHLGTVDEMRWPQMSLSVLKSDLADEWLALKPGDRIDAHNCFPQLPGVDIDVIVEGWSETLRAENVRVDLNCVPASPYQVLELEHSSFGWLHPNEHSLDESIGPSDTTFDVAVPGATWTTDAGDYPRGIIIGGEIMTVTAVGAVAGGVQQFTVTRGGNGITKPHAAGSPVVLHPTFVLGL